MSVVGSVVRDTESISGDAGVVVAATVSPKATNLTLKSLKMKYQSYTVKQLHTKLREVGLSIKGKKAELVARMVHHVSGNRTATLLTEDIEDNYRTAERESNDEEDERSLHEIPLTSSTVVGRPNSQVNFHNIHFTPKEIMDILPEFNPNDDKGLTASEWIRRVEKLKNFYKWVDALLLISIGPKLKGNARLWYERLEDLCTNWGEFANQFRDKFTPIMNERINFRLR